MKKKGETELTIPEFLKIVLAIAGIILVIFFGYKLYKIASEPTDFKSARNLLEDITTKINILNSGQSNDFTFQGFPRANEWYLQAWPRGSPTDEKPEDCFLETCICICKNNCLDKNYAICETINYKEIET